MRTLAALSAALLLCASAAAQEEGEAQFRKCGVCHAIGPDAAHKIGPHLNGVVGAPVAIASGYSYSQALQRAGEEGLVWDEQLLTRYLKNPRHTFPGTSMSFAGMSDRADIDAVIGYMARFDADGAQTSP